MTADTEPVADPPRERRMPNRLGTRGMPNRRRARRPSNPPREPPRRAVSAGALVVVLLTGLVMDRFVATSVPVADVVYAAFVYTLVVVFAPRMPVTAVAAMASGFCAAVELLQLTRVPADLSSLFPPARFVLGSTFAFEDLIAYGIGVIGTVATDLACSRLMRSR